MNDTTLRRSDPPAGWGGVLFGTLPFLLFGSAHLIQAAGELGWLPGWPSGLIRAAALIAYGLISFGLALCWLAGFPRWSLAYLGLALWLGDNYSRGTIYGVHYGLQGWLPLLSGLAVGLLASRDLAPVIGLIRSFWRDWTRLSFAVYAFIMPVMTVVFFDDDWGVTAFYGLIFDTLLLASGAALYLRSQTTWKKAISLQGAIILLAARNLFMGGWFGGPAHLASLDLKAQLGILLSWGGLMFFPGLLGLLRRGLGATKPLEGT